MSKNTTLDISYEDYDKLQVRFQSLWIQNHQLKELVVKLQDQLEELRGLIQYMQDYQ